MSIYEFKISEAIKLLRFSENDEKIRNFFGFDVLRIERDEYYGSLEFKDIGIGVIFKEAQWLIKKEFYSNPRELYLSGFHFYGDNDEGYANYKGELSNSIKIGNSRTMIKESMGTPLREGGGGMSSALKRLVPRWIEYSIGDATVHFQLNSRDLIDLVTLYAPDVAV